MLRKKNNLQKKSASNLLKISNDLPTNKQKAGIVSVPMEQKLRSLKEKIAKKKIESQKKAEFSTPQNKTKSDVLKFLSTKQSPTRFFSMDQSSNDNQFANFLKQNKIDNNLHLLQSHNIRNKEQLFNKSEEDISKMVQLPIGCRIKLKKIIRAQREKQAPKNQQTNKVQTSEKNVEMIVKQRKQNKIYQQLDYQIENQAHEAQNSDESEELEIIQKIADFFKWENKEKPQKIMAEEKIGQPKEWMYCWECLYLVNGNSLYYKDGKVLCCDQCAENYSKRLYVDEQMIVENEKAEHNNSAQEQLNLESQNQYIIDLAMD